MEITAEQIHQLAIDKERLAHALQEALEKIVDLEYELEQERMYTRNLNKAYTNMSIVHSRTVDAQ